MFGLDELVRRADQLEPVPANVIRLAGLVADPDSRARDIIGLVAYAFEMLMRWIERRTAPWKGKM